MSNAKRRGPNDGYTFTEKEVYRHRIWREIRKILGLQWPPKAVAMMPSIEGHEIDIARHYGFTHRAMHIIDNNPAIVATLRRRYPKLGGTYGLDAHVALSRMADAGIELSAANLDFTGNLSFKLLGEMNAIGRSGVFANDSVVCITVLKGRESNLISVVSGLFLESLRQQGLRLDDDELLAGVYGWLRFPSLGPTDLSAQDCARLILPILGLSSAYAIRTHIGGSYYSPTARQTMLWAAFRLYQRIGEDELAAPRYASATERRAIAVAAFASSFAAQCANQASHLAHVLASDDDAALAACGSIEDPTVASDTLATLIGARRQIGAMENLTRAIVAGISR